MLHSRPTLVFKRLIPLLPICIFSICPLLTTSCSWLFFYVSCLLSDSLSILQWNAGGLLVRSTELLQFFSPHPLTLSASRNSILTDLSLFRCLDFLLCILITPTPGLASSLMMPRMLAASSFSSGRAYLFLNFLPPLFLHLIPILIM